MLEDVATPDPYVDTAAQRPATGLDSGARTLILRVVEEVLFQQQANVPPQTVVIRWFFENRYGSYQDYMSAVESVWAGAERFRLEQAVAEAQVNVEFPAGVTMPSRSAAQEAGQLALLLSMPEPDFRLAVEIALRNLD